MQNWIKTGRQKASSIPHLRAVVLISLKESYLFLKNLYGLLTHPFKTIVQIRKKPDRSQTILVLGLPVWVGLGGLAVLVGIGLGMWFFQPARNRFLALMGVGLGLSCLLVAVVTVYLGFWGGKYLVWKKKLTKSRQKGHDGD